MKAARVLGQSRVEIVEVPDPVPAEGEVLVKLQRSLLCGSEMHGYRGDKAMPTNGGHEPAGQIIDASRSRRWKDGDRVGIHAVWGCGRCDWCARGIYTFCDAKRGCPGAHAELMAVPDHVMAPLPDDVDYEVGALLAGPLPPISAGRWAAAMLLAVGLQHVWHWNQQAIPQQPSLYGSLAGGLLWLAWITLPAAHGPWLGVVWEHLRSWRGLAFVAGWLYASARWFNSHELATRPDNVLRGVYPLLAWPVGGLALLAAARQVPDDWLLRAAARGRSMVAARSFPLWIAALAAGLCALVCYSCVGPVPHVEDGVAYLYQAKTFLAGGSTSRRPRPRWPSTRGSAGSSWTISDAATVSSRRAGRCCSPRV